MTPVILTAEVSDAYAGRLTPGMTGTATLATGQSYPASLRYVSRTASQQTRTFLIEAVLESGDDQVPAGVSASLAIPVDTVPATLISPSLLTLSDAGELGVRYIEADDTVQFAAVKVIDEGVGGAWVTAKA